MKNLNTFIVERLKLNKNTQLKPHFHPTSYDELRALLRKLLKERGKDAYLNDIDVSNITTFYDKENNVGLFEGLDPHNIKIDRWDVRNVKSMHDMFNRCKNFNCNLSNWKVNQVEDMCGMFRECTIFNSDLRKWKVNKVTDMRWMFMDAKKFNCDISKWDVSNVRYMEYMFYGCESFNYDLSNWKLNSVKDMESMFGACPSLKNKPSWYKG